MGLLHNGENSNKSYAILFGVRVRSCTPIGDSDFISRIALATEMTNVEKHQLRFQELEALDDKHLQAQQQIELYQARISKAFSKKVKEQISRKTTFS